MCAAEGEELAKINTKLLIKIVQYVVLTVLVLLVVICAAVFIQTKVNPDKIPSIFGYKPFVVLSGSMETEIFKGDLAVTREVDAESLQKNDIVAFRDAENHVVTHRVVDIIDVNGEKKLVTKGDNNNSNDSDTVRMKDVEGKYLFKLSGFGNLVMMMQEPLTLVVVLVIILVVGGIWMMLGNNKLSKEEREELEKLRKERSKSIEKNNKIIKKERRKMKSNKQKAGLMALVALAAIGSYFIAGTYAKYISEISGSDTASVAKWKWKIGENDIDSAEGVRAGYTFNLFNTIKDSGLTSDESDVADDKIAPGTSGSFEIDITNNSEVNATYAIAFTETNAGGVPIEYSTDGSTWVSIGNLSVPAAAISKNANAKAKIYWRWAYTGAQSTNYTSTQTDVTDTALGFRANTSPTEVQVTATITVTQVD